MQKPTRRRSKILQLENRELIDAAQISQGLTDVLASLSASGDGSTLELIHKRTGFPKSALAIKLEILVKKGTITYDANSRRYFSQAEHIDWTGEAGNRLAKSIYQSSVSRLGQVADGAFGNPETLFLNTAISVSKAQLPQLRTELKELLLKFADRTVEADSDGDTVIQIVTGLFEGRLASL